MRRLGILVSLALATIAGTAFAQDPAPAPTEPAPAAEPAPVGATSNPAMGTTTAVGAIPMELVRRGVQGSAGHVSVRGLLNASLSKEQVFKPFSISPDVFYGVSDQLQVGLLHNGPMGWQTTPGASLCLAGKENNCPKVYDNVGFDALYALLQGQTDLSGHASFYFMKLKDPMLLELTLGAAIKQHLSDQLAIWADPQIGIGLNKRDAGNKEFLWLPVELQYQIQPQLAALLLTGIYSPFSHFGDLYQIPVGIGAVYTLSEMVDIGLRFSFDNLLGKQPPGGGRADERSLAALVNLRF